MRLLPLFLLVSTAQAAASVPISPILLRRIDAPAASVRFGRSVSSADFDRDGVPDVAAGAEQVRVYSGSDGRLLRTIPAEGDEVDFVGDTDGDAVPDLVLASLRRRLCILVSGSSGAGRGAFGYNIGSDEGESVDGLGDVDGDGVPDFAIAGEFPGGEYTQVISGKDVYQVLSAIPKGYSVAGLGDVNGDGRGDFVAGRNLGIQTFSGRTGQPLYSLPGQDPVLAGCDVDGDGIKDVLLSMPALVGGSPAALVVSHSGASGALIDSVIAIPALEPAFFRGFVVGVGDVDGDGKEDFAASYAEATVNGNAEAGVVNLFSGTGERLATIGGTTAGAHFGWSLAAPGDVDGDGAPDLVVGQPDGPSGAGSGAVFVYRLKRGALAPRLEFLPGTCPNRMALHGNGDVELAFLGGGEFDPAEIDPATVRLAGIAPERERNHPIDVVSADAPACGCAAGLADGVDDRVFLFGAADMRTRLAVGETRTLFVTATLVDGRQVEGAVCATLDRHRNQVHDADVAGAWPNPVRAGGTVALRLAAPEVPGPLAVYDLRGRRVADLEGVRRDGRIEAAWNTKDERGALVPPGIYLIRLNGAPASRVLVLDR